MHRLEPCTMNAITGITYLDGQPVEVGYVDIWTRD